MKKFLTRISLFLLPIVILAYPLDRFFSHNLAKSNRYPGEFEVWTDIYRGNIDADIAIYGSSRAWVHIDPQIISDSLHVRAYNFGLDGHNFSLQYLRHLEYFRHNRHPRLIVVSVDIFSLQKREDLYEADQFLPYMLWNKNIHDYTSSYIGYKKYDYFLPLVRYGGHSDALFTAVRDFVHQPAPPYRDRGYKGMNMSWNMDFEKARQTMKAYQIKLDTANMNLFNRFLNECRGMNIPVLLVYSPEYVEGQQFVSNRQQVIDIYRNYATAHQLKFLDYSADSISYRKELFYNTGHLNHRGSSLFSAELASDIKSLGLLNPVAPDGK